MQIDGEKMYVKMEGIELYIKDDMDKEVIKMYQTFLKKYLKYIKRKIALKQIEG